MQVVIDRENALLTIDIPDKKYDETVALLKECFGDDICALTYYEVVYNLLHQLTSSQADRYSHDEVVAIMAGNPGSGTNATRLQAAIDRFKRMEKAHSLRTYWYSREAEVLQIQHEHRDNANSSPQ